MLFRQATFKRLSTAITKLAHELRYKHWRSKLPSLGDLPVGSGQHPLRDDFRMYYTGSWVSRELPSGGREVMLVREVVSHDDGCTAREITFHGPVVRMEGDTAVDVGGQAWPANTVSPFNPTSGYYRLGASPVYVEFSLENRTNRKGFQSGHVLVGGKSAELTPRQVCRVFNQGLFPGQYGRDLCIHKSSVLWRGQCIGSFHDGDLKIEEQYTYVQELVCKLLAKSSALKPVQLGQAQL